MKNLFYLLGIILFTAIVTSCHTDQTNQETPAAVLEQRTTNWCDALSSPPAVSIISSYFNETTQLCCVTFRFTSAYTGKTVKLTTTDYNFNTQSGDPGDNNMYFLILEMA